MTRERRQPAYKQMAYETAIRNPERYLEILRAINKYDGLVLDDNNLITIVSALYKAGLVKSDGVDVNAPYQMLKKQIRAVNSSRNADGGFPRGYASRFWTYMRTPSELGFIYARYNEPLHISTLAKMMLRGEIDEQEGFAIQSFRSNRRSPYRNVSNDFNFSKFIFEVLKSRQSQGKALSLEQFIVAMFSEHGNVQDFMMTIDENHFINTEGAYNFAVSHYGINTRINTVTKDYPDVVVRLLLITGMISIRYSGKKFIELNQKKIDFFNELEKMTTSISESAKETASLFFDEVNSNPESYLELVLKYRAEDKIEATTYSSQLVNLINEYDINETKLISDLQNIASDRTRASLEAFKEIPAPLKLEFYIALLLTIRYNGRFKIRPNYKADHEGKPYSHAPGGAGDIDVFDDRTYWLIEVTLIQNRTQMLNSETTNVFRHMTGNTEFENHDSKYLSFVAPYIHPDTEDYFEYSVVKNRKAGINFKSYTISDFTEITHNNDNLEDMESNTRAILAKYDSGI